MSEKRYDKLPEDLSLSKFNEETLAFIHTLPELVLSKVNDVLVGRPLEDDVCLRFGREHCFAKIFIRLLAEDYEVEEEDYKVGAAVIDFSWSIVTESSSHEFIAKEVVEGDAQSLKADKGMIHLITCILSGERINPLEV